jgi:predicted neuraminidase
MGTGDTQAPVAWAVETPAGDIHTIAFRRDRAEDYVASASERVVPLYRTPQPTLTDEERHAIAVVRNCAMTRAERFLTQSDAEREATLVLWRLRERLG